MIDKLKQFLGTIGFLNDDQKVSITNIAVMIFVGITAFKSLFSGLDFSNSLFTWKVEGIDFASTLPMLFALLNYGHKRTVLTASSENKEEGKVK